MFGENLQLGEEEVVRKLLHAHGTNGPTRVLDDAEFGLKQSLFEPSILFLFVPGSELANDDVAVGSMVELAKERCIGERCEAYLHLAGA